MYHGWTSGSAPMLSSAIIAAKKVLPNINAKDVKKLVQISSDQHSHLQYPNNKTGHGQFNGARFMKAVKLYQEGLLTSKDLEDRVTFQKKLLAHQKDDPKVFKSYEELKEAYQKASNCEGLKQIFDKLILTQKVYGYNFNNEKINQILQDFYQSLGDIHNSILLDPKDKDGKISISPENYSRLIEYDPSSLPVEEKLKLLDLMKSINFSAREKDELALQFQSIFHLTQEESNSRSIPLRNSLIKKALAVFDEDFIESAAQSNEVIRKTWERIQAKLKGEATPPTDSGNSSGLKKLDSKTFDSSPEEESSFKILKSK